MSALQVIEDTRVRNLNDAFRTKLFDEGRLIVTAGVEAKCRDFLVRALYNVVRFDDFSPANVPNGEHEFGKFKIDDEAAFWKVNCCNNSLSRASDDPANPDLNTRIFAVIVALEY